MWLARPVYEFIPCLYVLVGAALFGAAWLIAPEILAGVCMLAGGLSMIAGIMLWLHRKDYRIMQSQYDARSLDD